MTTDRKNNAFELGNNLRPFNVSIGTLFLTRLTVLLGLGLALLIMQNILVFKPAIILSIGVLLLVGLKVLSKKNDVIKKFIFYRPELDFIIIILYLYFSGGMNNPSVTLLFIPIIFAIFFLPKKECIIFIISSGFLISLLNHFGTPNGVELNEYFWIGLVYSTLVMAMFLMKSQEEMNMRLAAVSATGQALAREQKVSALGALAAAAAHELGTPLGTITLAAREVLSDLKDDSLFKEDLSVIVQEAVRCREILERLSATHADEREDHLYRLPIEAIINQVINNHAVGDKKVILNVSPMEKGSEDQPLVTNRSEIIHGLGNFIENAVGFATDSVEIIVSWNDEIIRVSIIDDGPGFDQSVLPNLGEPYISTRGGTDNDVLEKSGGAGGLGLGVFIAKTLIERTGGEVMFGNSMVGGAQIDVTWPREAFEADGEGWQSPIVQKDTWQIFEE